MVTFLKGTNLSPWEEKELRIFIFQELPQRKGGKYKDEERRDLDSSQTKTKMLYLSYTS